MVTHQPAVETEFSGALVEAMQACLLAEDPGARAVPFLMSGGTDAKAWDRLGIRCFGFAPLRLPPELDFVGMFHGVDERVPDRRRWSSAPGCWTGSSTRRERRVYAEHQWSRRAVEYEVERVRLGRHLSRNAVRQLLTDQAEYGGWELTRLRRYRDGTRDVWIRRKIIRVAGSLDVTGAGRAHVSSASPG